MYRYLDRPVNALEPADRLLVWSMRNWVRVLSSGRCPCAALKPAFANWGIGDAHSDFNTAMLVLNGEGQGRLCFAAPCSMTVNDDEARLLALFATATEGDDARLRRLAIGLVEPAAADILATAAERVMATLACAPPLWDRPNAERRA